MVRPLEPIKHGTSQGYRQEIHRGYRTCRACRRAWNEYCKPFNRANRAGNRRTRGLTPPPTPEQVIEEILRDSQDPTV